MGCQKMLPIVHGLEHKLGDRIAFHYFDISDATTAGIQKTLGFKSTPHFFLLSSDGKILGDRSGIIPEAEFEQWLRAAATTKQ
jgi:thioredoxin-related protein